MDHPLKKIVNGKEVELKPLIEQFFDYTWKQDKNLAFEAEGEQLLNQLPIETQVRLLKDFVFPRFLYCFKKLFEFVDSEHSQ